MGLYYRTPEMQQGKDFKCYNCGKPFFVILGTDYEISLVCDRCKTKVYLKCQYPIPRSPAARCGSLEQGSLQGTPVSTKPSSG